jgi:hypothetical protein
MTKKFTFIESQRSLRSEVRRALKVSPPTGRSSSSPSFQPSVFAMPSSRRARCAPGEPLPGDERVVARQLACRKD